MGKFYAVVKGRVPGIYSSWEECQKQVNGFSSPVFKSFKTEQAAKEFIKSQVTEQTQEEKLTPIQYNEKTNQVTQEYAELIEKNNQIIKELEGFVQIDLRLVQFPEMCKKFGKSMIDHNNSLISRKQSTLITMVMYDPETFELSEENIKNVEKNNELIKGCLGLWPVHVEKDGSVGWAGTGLLEYNNRLLKKRSREEPEQTKTKKKDFINVFCDGACKNNGRSNARGGIGIYFEGGEYKDVCERLRGKQTNNRAELTAILRVLEIVGNGNVVIHTDSQYSIDCIEGRKARHKNIDLFDKIDNLKKQRTGYVKLNKVEGHSGLDDGNAKADRLAVDGSLLE